MNEKTEERKTSAELKKQIDEATKAAKESKVPLTGMVASEINANTSPPDTTAKTESKSEPVKATEIAAAENKSADLKEWAQKKGIDWTTEESILSALRKSDQKFHERQAERKAKEAPAQPGYNSYPPAQGAPYQPPAYPNNVGYPNPAYQPSVPNQRQLVENIARQYNMLPEDVERLAAFNRDFFETATRAERERMQREVETIRVENQKNSVFRELSSDPVFKRPDVAVEFHRVLEEMQEHDPQSFEQDPTAYKRAFDRTLNNLGRRYLEGKPLQEGVPPSAMNVTPPTTPPRPFGQGSGGGYNENENTIDPREFAKLPLAEKTKVLEKMGLRTAYQ